MILRFIAIPTLVTALICSGCSTATDPLGRVRYEDGRWYGDERAYTTMRALYLHAALTKDTQALVAHLEAWLTLDSELMAAVTEEPGFFDAKEEERIWRTLRIIAVLQEKYPSDKWAANSKVTKALERARNSNPAEIARLRNLDWSSSFLERGMGSERK
jgi:hypothetical protein